MYSPETGMTSIPKIGSLEMTAMVDERIKQV